VYCGGVIALLSAIWIAVYTIQIRGIKLPIYLSNISTGMMFFSFGYLAKKIVTSKKVEFSILICYIIAVAFLDIKIDMRVGTFEPNCFYWIPICLLGIYAINIAAKYLMNKPNIWSYIGKNSMGFYCLHWLIIQIISLFFVDDGTSNIPFLITLVIGNIIILPILVMLIKKSKYKSIIE
jgi:surface polysaccharide O-acyltransferase-like enzyme